VRGVGWLWVILGGQCSGLDGVVRELTVHDVGRCGLAMPWALRAGAVVDGLGTAYDRVLCVAGDVWGVGRRYVL
jgi:hypothetical protein